MELEAAELEEAAAEELEGWTEDVVDGGGGVYLELLEVVVGGGGGGGGVGVGGGGGGGGAGAGAASPNSHSP